MNSQMLGRQNPHTAQAGFRTQVMNDKGRYRQDREMASA
jgi:hypothetical protein